MRAWAIRHRLLLVVALVVLDTLAIFSATTYELFIDPHIDPVRRSDAVVVIAGGPLRLKKGIELVERGIAPLLIVSNPHGTWAYKEEAPHLCDQRGRKRSYEVVCFDPSPESTQGEARFVQQIAAARHLRSIVLVTSYFHVTRARIEMRRCYHGRLAVIGTPLNNPWKEPFYIALEWPKLAYAETLNRGC
jgi:uncharacterized SAM-binding protein YcdF (DUF218 family)